MAITFGHGIGLGFVLTMAVGAVCGAMEPPPIAPAVRVAKAEPAKAPTLPRLGNPIPGTAMPSPELMGQQATKLLRELLPREYENRKKWGLTEKVVSGVQFRREGLRIETHRRWREVKQGLWKRYKAKLVDPEQQLELQVERLEHAGPGRAQMDIHLRCKLDLEAQIVKYQRNLRLLSLTALADATVELRLTLELGASLDATKLPPDIVFDIVIKDAQLDLVKFRLRELSDIKGAPARQLGKLVHDVAEGELKDQRERLVEKLNAKIDKKRDRLRFSFQDLLPDSLRGKSEEDGEQPEEKAAREDAEKKDKTNDGSAKVTSSGKRAKRTDKGTDKGSPVKR